MSVKKGMNLHYWMVSISMGIVDTHSIEAHALQLMYRELKFAHFSKSFLLLKRIDYIW